MVRLRGRLRKLLGEQAVEGGDAICNAPGGSMYLDQRGDVRACCQNAGFPLGNVTESSLREIWHGDRAARLRGAVDAGDLSLGCNFCRWQIDEGNDDAVFARTFDHLEAVVGDPVWPQQLELSLSNACNLQCVMCNGEWSSSIRTHREGLPPLPKVYGERFFDELVDFLPHLRVVKFLGGEPFLGAEPLRVMELLAAEAPHVEVHVTTNGTQLTPRIERILDRLDVHVVVSLDGVHADTYESIRVGSSFDGVVENIDRFLAYTRGRGTGFSLSHCLMVDNWAQFADFCEFAEHRRCSVWVNTVTEPHEVSLYHLPPSELRDVVAGLGSRDARVRRRLSGRRRAAWDDQLARLRAHLAALERFEPPDYVAKRRQLGFAWLAPQRAAEGERFDAVVAEGVGRLVEVDADGVVCTVADVGTPSAALLAQLGDELVGGSVPPCLVDPEERDDKSVVTDDLHRHRHVEDGLELVVLRLAVRDGEGVVSGAKYFADERGSHLLDEESAESVARRIADSPELVVALHLREADVVAVEGPCRDVLGVEGHELVGRGIDEVAGAVAEPTGAAAETVRTSDVSDRLQRTVTTLVSANGASELHSVADSVTRDGVVKVWVARRTPTAEPPVT